MSAPNPDDPLDATIAEHWKKDEASAIAEGRSHNHSMFIEQAVFKPNFVLVLLLG